MTDDCPGGYIDGNRTVPLDDVGGGNLLAATVIGTDYTALVILDADHLHDGTPMIDPRCRAVGHEQTGPLPIEVVRRITVAQRTHRCGRPTESGRPCRATVAHPSDACHWHQTHRKEKTLMSHFPVLDAPRTDANNELGRVIVDHLGDVEPYIEETDSWITMPLRLVHDDAAGLHLEIGPYSLSTPRDIARLRAALAAYDDAVTKAAK